MGSARLEVDVARDEEGALGEIGRQKFLKARNKREEWEAKREAAAKAKITLPRLAWMERPEI